MMFDYRIDKNYLAIIESARKNLPVNVERLAKNLKMEVVYRSMDQKGYIELINDTAKIYVNKSSSSTRKRFTIAHEIAHYLIHRDELMQKGFLDRDINPLSVYSSKTEAEASALAADILMPMDEINSLLEYGNITKIDELAKRLEVSERVLKIKLRIPSRMS